MIMCWKDPTCGIFLKRGLFKDIKNYIPMCQTGKYKNTNTKYSNTQIQNMTKCQRDPACGIFMKRGLIKRLDDQGDLREESHLIVCLHTTWRALQKSSICSCSIYTTKISTVLKYLQYLQYCSIYSSIQLQSNSRQCRPRRPDPR